MYNEGGVRRGGERKMSGGYGMGELYCWDGWVDGRREWCERDGD